MAVFRHSRQLQQLKTRNPVAHSKATRLLKLGKTTRAITIILEAMHAAFTAHLALSTIPQAPEAPKPLYGLVIASKKFGFGTTCNASDRILWWKMAGQPIQENLNKELSLVSPVIQKKLQGYTLVDTEVQPHQIIRKYKKMATDDAEIIWAEIERRVTNQEMPNWKNTQIPIGKLNGQDVSLYRRATENVVVLHHPILGNSGPIIRWGRDWDPNRQSASQGGRWKPTKKAQQNLDAWLNPRPAQPSQWRWSAGGWGSK